MPLVTILVPAYKEEPEVVLRTLLSAACQTYACRRVVLLLDDPHVPADATDQHRLDATRALPDRIADLFEPLRTWLERERAGFTARRTQADTGMEAELGHPDGTGRWHRLLARQPQSELGGW